jgi:predicted DNA-binding protein (MmcQ/YjbR family)
MTHPTLDAVIAQLEAMLNTTIDNTFGEQTDVYRVANKMFALLNADAASLTLKALPEDSEALRAQYACVSPGYYMNKRHWITIDLNGPIAGDELAELVAESRRLVVASLTKAQRAAIDS